MNNYTMRKTIMHDDLYFFKKINCLIKGKLISQFIFLLTS